MRNFVCRWKTKRTKRRPFSANCSSCTYFRKFSWYRLKKKYLEVKYGDEEANMVTYKILLQRCVNPKKVDLPDGRTFYARYERMNRKNLPANVTIKKVWIIGPRCGRERKQQGTRILGSVFKLGKKLYKPSYFKKRI